MNVYRIFEITSRDLNVGVENRLESVGRHGMAGKWGETVYMEQEWIGNTLDHGGTCLCYHWSLCVAFV